MNEIISSMPVPKDAGKHAEGLRQILQRIPTEWGRELRCDRGWYDLIIGLDQRLAAVNPDYEVHQVKEKFGTLRYYFDLPELQSPCCIKFKSEFECPAIGVVRTQEDRDKIAAWLELMEAHHNTAECMSARVVLENKRDEQNEQRELMQKIVYEFEKRSAEICELTGNPGVLMKKNYLFKTLDPLTAGHGWERYKQEIL
jgi:hypothetical protein